MNFFGKRINGSITKKLVVYTLGIVLLMNVIMLLIIGIRSTGEANNYAANYSQSLSVGIAGNVKVYIEEAFETTNTLANTLSALRFTPGLTREAIEMIFINVLTGNEKYIGVWTMWEPDEFDGQDDIYIDDALYEDSEGRFSLLYYLEDQFVTISWGSIDNYSEHFYSDPMSQGAKSILNPYLRNYSGIEGNDKLITSVVTPIIKDGEVLGVVGIDIELSNMHSLVSDVSLFESGTAVILSNDLHIATHINKGLNGKPYDTLTSTNLDHTYNAVQSGQYYSFEDINANPPLLRTFVPIEFSGTDQAWSVMSEIPLKEITASSRQLFILILLIGITGLMVISLVVVLVARTITKPILKINKIVNEAAIGKLNGDIGLEKRNDEVGRIAQGMKKLLSGLKNTANFARKVGEGNYDEQYTKLSNEDELGEALLSMQNNLKQAQEEELKRKEEDKIRNWITRGQALFADISRQNTDNVRELSYLIIAQLVKYMEINQGGLFLLNDDNPDDKYIELYACYAYNRRKYKEKRINIGEGLVGACWLEKKYIYLEKIPENYLKITSGLGDENPRSLLIMPLIINEEVLGIFELASFKGLNKFEIEFVEKVGEITASVISNLRTASNTKILLEKSQQQAEEMRAQEEEMRQNMEELSATQEAMNQKEQESQNLINQLTARIKELEESLAKEQ